MTLPANFKALWPLAADNKRSPLWPMRVFNSSNLRAPWQTRKLPSKERGHFFRFTFAATAAANEKRKIPLTSIISPKTKNVRQGSFDPGY